MSSEKNLRKLEFSYFLAKIKKILIVKRQFFNSQTHKKSLLYKSLFIAHSKTTIHKHHFCWRDHKSISHHCSSSLVGGVQKLRPKLRHQKPFLVRLYHHTKFQRNRSTTKIFMSISIIFWFWKKIFEMSLETHGLFSKNDAYE
jgi:hypothetical protein